MRVISIVLLVLLLISFKECSSEDGLSFKREVQLKGTVIHFHEPINPKRIIILDTLLIIQEEPNKKALKIFSLDSIEKMIEAVPIGRGPGELINPAYMIVDEEKEDVWICDFSKYKWFKFPFDSLILIEDYKSFESFDINLGLFPMLNPFYFRPESIGFSSYNLRRKGLIFFMDYSGSLIDSLTIPLKACPNIWDNVDDNDNPYLINYCNAHERFVIANTHSNEISILNRDGDIYNRISLGKKMSFKNNFDRRNYASSYNIYTDNKFIYCFYIGKDFIDYKKNSNQRDINYTQNLLIFNWEGDRLFNIGLDHELMCMDFDYDKHRIIGFAEDFPEGLVEYDLSSILNTEDL